MTRYAIRPTQLPFAELAAIRQLLPENFGAYAARTPHGRAIIVLGEDEGDLTLTEYVIPRIEGAGFWIEESYPGYVQDTSVLYA